MGFLAKVSRYTLLALENLALETPTHVPRLTGPTASTPPRQ